MQTVFYLHGGNTDMDTKDNKWLFTESPDVVSARNILVVYFARPHHTWDEQYLYDKKKFSAGKKDKQVELASVDKAIFAKQLEAAEVVFIRGGDTDILLSALKKVSNFHGLIRGKVIVGSSAGALVFARYYWSNSRRVVQAGLGILPVKLFCHYTAQDTDNLRLLEEYKGETMQVITVSTGCYVKYRLEVGGCNE